MSHELRFPQIIGVLNFTPDSFADGGLYFSEESALEKTKQMLDDGADIIDFGAESTNPLIENPLSLDDELSRIKPVLPKIIDLVHKKNKLVSIDTYKYEVAKFAIDKGVDIVNDQSGFSDKRTILLLADSQKKLIMMHSICLPIRRHITIPENEDVIKVVYSWAQLKRDEILSQNIRQENIIFDPGIGFGKTHSQSWQLINNILDFKSLGLAICIGHSRKGCIREMGDPDKVTLETSKFLSNKVNYLRVHDVLSHRKLFTEDVLHST